MLEESRRDATVIILSFLGFVGLGSSAGLLGLAWPTMRQQFNLNQDSIGLVLIAGTIGYMTSSFFNGRVMIGLGTARALLVGAIILSLGLFGYSLAPSFPLLIGIALVTGFGNGTIDAGLNNYVSSYYNARQMNWLHASFGGGWVLGSLVLTAFLSAGMSWRFGYAAAGVLNLAVVVMVLLSAKLWRNGLPQQGQHEDVPHAPMRETLRLPMLWLSLAIILIYVGLEASPSTWAYSIFTEARGIRTDSAGLWVTLSLAVFTFGRIFFGFVGERVARTTLLRLSILGAIAGALLWWWSPSDLIGLVGLLILSFAQAPMFALIILGTAGRVGARHTASAIGMQVSAAGAGFAVVPSIGGVIAQNLGLLAILPFIVLCGIAIFVLHEIALIGAARVNAAQPISVAAD